MIYKSTNEFILEHLRYKQHWNAKVTIARALWQTLENDTFIDQYAYAKGSKFKVFETINFGWIVFKNGTLTPEGHHPGRLILRW